MKSSIPNPPSSISTVTVGTVTVPIYSSQVHSKGRTYPAFTVQLCMNGKRHRWTRSTLKAAEAVAREKAGALASGRGNVLHLTAEDAGSLNRARQLLLFTGKPIEQAAAEYAEADALLAPLRVVGEVITVPGAVASWVARHPSSVVRKPIAEIIPEMLAAKLQDGLSARWLADLAQRLGQFAKAFSGPLADVRGADLERWTRALPIGARSRNNLRICLKTLAAYAQARGYLPKDWRELEALTPARAPEAPIEIFTPAEMQSLLTAAPARLLPYLALGAFAGLRTAEIQRLDWRQFKWTAGHLVVEAAQAKTAARRLVPLNDALRAWLAPLRQDSGPVLTVRAVAVSLCHWLTRANATRTAPLVWKQNALRHSFITYRVAETKDVAAVALEAGNSPAIIFRNYRELVTATDAAAWFALRPQTQTSRIIQIP